MCAPAAGIDAAITRELARRAHSGNVFTIWWIHAQRLALLGRLHGHCAAQLQLLAVRSLAVVPVPVQLSAGDTHCALSVILEAAPRHFTLQNCLCSPHLEVLLGEVSDAIEVPLEPVQTYKCEEAVYGYRCREAACDVYDDLLVEREPVDVYSVQPTLCRGTGSEEEDVDVLGVVHGIQQDRGDDGHHDDVEIVYCNEIWEEVLLYGRKEPANLVDEVSDLVSCGFPVGLRYAEVWGEGGHPRHCSPQPKHICV